MKQKIYIFDLDNTLIFTDVLNNQSYNYALKAQGMECIYGKKRITRNCVSQVYPNLTEKKLNIIIDLKQKHYIDNLEMTTPNEWLIQFLNNKRAESCILWTSASRERTLATLKHYKISKSFANVIFSNKDNLTHDINNIKMLLHCGIDDMIFYEDNLEIIDFLNNLKLKVEIVTNII